MTAITLCSGVTVTKELNGTTRAVLDNLRQVFIWAFSLIVGWESFNWMTVKEKRRNYDFLREAGGW